VKPADFDYELPAELVAQVPAARRDEARLFVHRAREDESEHRRVADLPELLAPGDLLVVNDTRVVPARLYGRRRSGGRVEFLFLEPAPRPDAPRAWKTLVNPARKLHPGERVDVDGGLAVRLIERPVLEGGAGRPRPEWIAELLGPAGEAGADPLELLERHGHVPLPPYIERSAESGGAAEVEQRDRERYQTVYARVPGAAAAPTAGLHFTPELLERLARAGVESARVTLHVGLGTFQPLKVDDLADHRMHGERYELPAETVERIAAARRRGGRVVAVGTTTARVLEHVASLGELAASRGTTELFLRPGSRFRAVDALLTNFHLPRSSLLVLVSAFVGRERVLRLYREAVERRYRFYSYGDAMLLFGDRSGIVRGGRT